MCFFFDVCVLRVKDGMQPSTWALNFVMTSLCALLSVDCWKCLQVCIYTPRHKSFLERGIWERIKFGHSQCVRS